MKTVFLKIVAVLRWFVFAVLMAGFGSLTAPIMFPFAYVLRTPLRVARTIPVLKFLVIPLWIYLDDEEMEVYPRWWLKDNNLKVNTDWNLFKASYKWGAVRNPFWNFYSFMKLSKDDIKILVSSKGVLHKNFVHLHDDVYSMAVLKYVDELGNYNDNAGEFLSAKYSYFGEIFTWYKIRGRSGLFWRFSSAWQYGRFSYEIQLGSNDYRYTIRFKIKKDLILFEDKSLNQ